MASEWGAITNSFTNNYGKTNHQTPFIPMALSNPGLSYEEVLNEDFQFDMNGHDVMVFLHIQKTGGTSFGRHLVMDLDLQVDIKGNAIFSCFTFIQFFHAQSFSDHVNANENVNGAIVFVQIATRTGCSRAIQPDGNAVCMRIGPN